MRDIYEFAEFFASGWRLANPNLHIPINDGRVDLSLYECRASLPDRFRSTLTFGNTRIGFRCYELPEILHAAYNNLLISAPTPAHMSANVIIDETTAYSLLRRRGITPDEAITFSKEVAMTLVTS
jgi:hypothetical protein